MAALSKYGYGYYRWLATDYCVKTTVLQLLKGGNWQVIVNEAACRGIAPDTIETAWQEMSSA